MAPNLPSWNEGTAKQAIVDLMKRVTQPDSPDHVRQADRIAAFENDGTLWCEKPAYIQGDFLMRKMAAQAEQDPSLRSKQPWKTADEKDLTWIGDVVTRYYEGDDSGLRVIMDGVISLS